MIRARDRFHTRWAQLLRQPRRSILGIDAAVRRRKILARDFSPPVLPPLEEEGVAVWVVHWRTEDDSEVHYYLDGLNEDGSLGVRIEVTGQVGGDHGGAFVGVPGFFGGRLPHAVREGPGGFFYGVYLAVDPEVEWRVVRWRRAGAVLVDEEFIGTLPDTGFGYTPAAMFFTPDGTLWVPPALPGQT